jgi:hypothetical protein
VDKSIPSIVRERLGDAWIPSIYADKVRAQRTRAYQMEIPPRENPVEIIYTLLGIELKVGKRRLSCPDLAAARYIQIFARIGCREIAVPYDITKIGPIADELEVSWQRGLLLLANETAGRSLRAKSQFRMAFVREIRAGIESVGPGEAMPAFRQSTKQRTAG